jgi:hypothetical protein
VSNSKKACFIHPFYFNKLVLEPGSVDQERSTMAKKKKKKKKKKKRKKGRKKREMLKKKNMVSLDIYFKES